MSYVNNWRLGKIGDEIESLNAGVSVNSDVNSIEGNHYILKTSAVARGKVNLCEVKPVISKDITRLKCSLKANSILISRMNTPDLVGECGYVETDCPFIFLPDRIWQTTLKQGSKLNCKWLTYLLNTEQLRQKIKNSATGTSNSMKNISKDQILDIEIYYPDPEEQTSIAETLSDVDCLLIALQKLIAKKKAIKQGAMRELLTGRKRLPEFSDKWIHCLLKDIAPLQRGFDLPLSDITTGNFPVVFSNGINVYHKQYLVKGPGVVTGRSGTIGKLFYINDDFWPHNTTLWVTNFNGNNPKYIYYLFHLISWGLYSSGSGVPTLNRNDVHRVSMNIPSSIDEQTAIASVLSDMDAEIEQLEKKLTKYRLIKQGMMQELLTGRIRLIES